jgi:hypothetical protein
MPPWPRASAWSYLVCVLASLVGAPVANAQDDLSTLRQMVGRLHISGSWHIHLYTTDGLPVSLTEATTFPVDRGLSGTDEVGVFRLECTRNHARVMISLRSTASSIRISADGVDLGIPSFAHDTFWSFNNDVTAVRTMMSRLDGRTAMEIRYQENGQPRTLRYSLSGYGAVLRAFRERCGW